MDSSQDNIGFTSSHSSSVGVRKKNNKLWIIVVVALLLALGGYFLYANSQNQKNEETSLEDVVVPTDAPTAAPTEEATPSGTITPTDKPEAKPTTGVVSQAADLNIQVLNGSGTVGAAGETATFLKDKGYKNVETGNADNFDYTGVTVRIKDSQKKFLSTITKDLGEKYTVETGDPLPSDSTSDVTVTVGK